MNVYDKAHELARALKDTPEYRQYMAAKEKVNQKPELSQAINDFTEKNMQMQAQMMSGAAPQDMMGQMQSLYAVLMADPLAAEYLQAQIVFSKMVADVYGILGEVVGIGQQQI